MLQEHKTTLLTCLADAAAKLEALPARLKAEAEQAQKERRKPFAIVPMVEVQPVAMLDALVSLTDVPQSLAHCVGTLRHVCENQIDTFCMRCDQLVEILSLAGVKGE